VSTPGARPAAAGSERLARAVVTGCAVLVVAACFGFSFGNVLALGRYLGVPEWVAWLVAPAVDLTVVGLIVGVRYLSLRGVEGRRLRPARLMLIAAGLATWALNTAHALLVRHHPGVVAYDSLAPLLLIGWAEVGPWFLRQFRAAANQDTSESGLAAAETGRQVTAAGTVPAAVGPVAEAGRAVPMAEPVASAAGAAAASRPGPAPADRRPSRLSPPAGTTPATDERDGRLVGRTGRADRDVLAEQARRLAAAHLAEHGRPISRDALRRALRVSNQVASQLLRSVNARPLSPQPAGQDGTDGQDGRRPDREAVVPVPVVPPVAARVGPDRDGHRG
jgi:hypothetical protein